MIARHRTSRRQLAVRTVVKLLSATTTSSSQILLSTSYRVPTTISLRLPLRNSTHEMLARRAHFKCSITRTCRHPIEHFQT
jgi:hypothetical protein